MNKSDTEQKTASASQNGGKKTKEFEVQWGVKWTNFNATVEASSPKEAFKKALELPVDELTITAGCDEVYSLSGLLNIARNNRVQIHDEDGNEFDHDDETTGCIR